MTKNKTETPTLVIETDLSEFAEPEPSSSETVVKNNVPRPGWLPDEDYVVLDMTSLTGRTDAEVSKRFDDKTAVLSSLSLDASAGTVKIVDIVGVLQRNANKPAADYEKITAAIRDGASDENVDAIMLRIDSPGGAAMGVLGTAQAIRDAKTKKPVIAWFDSMCCSGAYWLASQASKIYASDSMSHVGSIGTFMVLWDYNRMLTAWGIDVHLVSTGGAKGSGAYGSPVNEQLLENCQQMVLDIQAHFNEAIAVGRGLSTKAVEKLADGTVSSADSAIKSGLIDGIASWSQLGGLIQTQTRKKKETKVMSGNQDQNQVQNTPGPATIQQIEAACPGASAEFVLGQVRSGATEQQAVQAHAAALAAENAQLKADAEARQQEQAKAATEPPKVGNPAAPTPNVKNNSPQSSSHGYEDAVEEFGSRVEVAMNRGLTRQQAVRAVAEKDPELHVAYKEATAFAVQRPELPRE